MASVRADALPELKRHEALRGHRVRAKLALLLCAVCVTLRRMAAAGEKFLQITWKHMPRLRR